MDSESFDLLVVGAGTYGLGAAATYLEVNPSANIVVVDGAKSLGGVWATERLYPGLRSNNLLGTYEYGGFPMDEESFRVKQGQAIPGEEIHRYLESYAIRFNVLPKLRFQTKVRTVEQNGDAGWKVHVVMDVDGTPKSSKLFTKKLIVATGLCSEPLRVELPGMDQFGGPIFHIQGFRAHSDVLQKADTITVLGSSKSTWDVAYEFAANGVQVEWVIRESGHGPIWHSPPYVTPLKKWLEKLVFTRLLTCFSPSIWEDADGYGWIRRLFHGTFVGRFFVNLFWKILENDLVTLNRYDEHPETKKLKPWKAAFWTGNSLSILNYPTSIFELVKRGQIHVHVADIVQLSCGQVHLSSGEVLASDAIIYGSGWKPQPSIEFLPTDLAKRLGLPHQSSQKNELVLAADRDILGRFPRLKDQPTINPKSKPLSGDPAKQERITEPFRLYRLMAPPDPDLMKLHNIGFAGMILVLSNTMCAQAQGLWLAAYLDGRMPIESSPDQILWDATLTSQFQKWRRGGGISPDLVFETLPYFDSLMKDLGLKVHRKKNMLTEWTQAYGPEDYQTLIQEWKDNNAKEDRSRPK